MALQWDVNFYLTVHTRAWGHADTQKLSFRGKRINLDVVFQHPCGTRKCKMWML